MIKRRVIFYVGGYDPQSSEVFFRHLDRQIGYFGSVWDVGVEQGEIEVCSEHISRRRFVAKGGTSDWSTTTDFYFLSSDDVVSGDYNHSFIFRLSRYLLACFNYLFSGTAFSFARTAWRYFVYFLYPLLVFSVTFYISVRLATLSPLPILFSPLIFLAVFWCLKFFIWDRFYIMKAMETWTFAYSFIYRRRLDINERIDELSRSLSDSLAKDDFDEMLLIGHSIGGAFLMDGAWRVLQDFASANKKKITFLTLGSTILKVGLHPQAQWFRNLVGELFSHRHLSWIEYQSHIDMVNFYKTDSSLLMNLSLPLDSQGYSRPIIRRVRFGGMLGKSYYHRIRFRLFRIHYQFIYASRSKFHYDFPAICFGPSTHIRSCGQPP